VRVGLAQVPAAGRGWIHKSGNKGFIKLVADAELGVLVGATSAGPAGGEVLSMRPGRRQPASLAGQVLPGDAVLRRDSLQQ
jgi:hypothetical protein